MKYYTQNIFPIIRIYNNHGSVKVRTSYYFAARVLSFCCVVRDPNIDMSYKFEVC